MPDLKSADELLEDFQKIWDKATLQEHQEIVHTLVQTVCLDAEHWPVVAIGRKLEFDPLLEVMDLGKSEVSSPACDTMILAPGAGFRRQ